MVNEEAEKVKEVLKKIAEEKEENKRKDRKISTVTLEGDEVPGITEEIEEALKPEERQPLEILWGFAKYPFWLAIGIFIISFIVLWYYWGSAYALPPLKVLLGAVILAAIVATAASAAVISWTKVIPSSPPFVGVITLFGRITKWVAPAGYFLTIPYIRDVILIDMRRIDQDFDLQDVVTRDNAVVRVKGHLSFQPDPKRLPMYIKSGIVTRDETSGAKGGVLTIVDNLFPQYQRTEIKKLNLEEALAASEQLSAGIAGHLTGELNFDMARMSRDGRSDTKGLGITIFVANITSIETAGETKKALEAEVQEKFQRKAEVYEVVTRGRQTIAKMFTMRGKDITEMNPEEIQKELQTIKDKNPKEFDRMFDSWFTAFLEYEAARAKPGSIIPGMRERLISPGGSIPLDVLGALLSGFIQKPIEAKTEKPKKSSKNKQKGKGTGKKEESKEAEEEEDEQ